jgi:hypothetical protein
LGMDITAYYQPHAQWQDGDWSKAPRGRYSLRESK